MTQPPDDTALTTPDGQRLHLQHWPLAPARGTVLIVHGLGEHIGRYAHVAAHLQAAGWRVLGADQRGHGRSTGPRGGLGRDDDLLRDLALVIDHVRAHHPGPLVLLGHSMGGLVAARYVAEAIEPRPADWSRPVEGLILSSPALAADTSAFQNFLLATLGALTPGLAVNNGLQPRWISRDPDVVAAYRADPLVHDRITPRLGRFILAEGETVRQRAGRWQVPTLLVYAGSDRCVAPRGSAEFAAAAPKQALTTHAYGPLYHEIFNEPEREQVLATVSSWLHALPAAAT